MKPITFDQRCYRIGDNPIYLNSGEFHYFRVPRDDWKRRMELFKAAGGNCIATYVPWIIHEPEEGEFDFGDHDYSDLEGFLRTAAEVGLYVIARPGPYQYSELLYGGLPTWLHEKYPAVLAQHPDGTPISDASVSYLHPVFLEKVHHYFAQVCPILAKYTVTRGGPIVFTQPDNELAGIQVWLGGMDYHPETMGFGTSDGRYPRFLRERYESVDEVNRLHGTEAKDFHYICPNTCNDDTPGACLCRKDYFDFYCTTLAEYFGVLMDMFEEFGLDVQFVHNSGNPNMNNYFVETNRQFGDKLLIGSDHYYSLGQTWAQNNPTPQYAIKVFYSNEMLRLMGFPPTIFEIPGGSASDWPAITATDAKTCYLANVALGMKGHNYYIFTGGINPPGVGENGDNYDYGASISASGEIRPLYHAQKEFGLFMQDNRWLVEAEQEYDFRIAMDWDMTRSSCHEQGKSSLTEKGSDVWSAVQTGLLTTAFCSSLSPAFCALDSDDWMTDTDTPVIVPASDTMSRSNQQRIIEFVENGGRVILMPTIPCVDEQLQPCSLLADFLGNPVLESIEHGVGVTCRLTMGQTANIFNNGRAFTFSGIPEDAEIIGIEEFSGKPFAWEITHGSGRLMVLGFRWMHSRFEHSDMLRQVLDIHPQQLKIQADTPSIWSTLRTAGNRSMLFIMNLNSSRMSTKIGCHPAWSDVALGTGSHELEPMSVKCVELG